MKNDGGAKGANTAAITFNVPVNPAASHVSDAQNYLTGIETKASSLTGNTTKKDHFIKGINKGHIVIPFRNFKQSSFLFGQGECQ